MDKDSEIPLTYEDIVDASNRIDGHINRTPLEKSLLLSDLLGFNLYFKKEFTLPTGSFKERGACNSLQQLKAAGTRGAIAASAGNHALALSYHGAELGIPITVVMPITAPIMKVARCKHYKARVIQYGNNIAEAKDYATKLGMEEGLDYVNGYNGHSILAGTGTIGKEICEDMKQRNVPLDAVVVPVGGAGLIAGISLAVKTLSPQSEVIGVEAESCPSFTESLKVGHTVKVPIQSTIADGLAVPEVGAFAFATAKPHVDQMELVNEDVIALAILRLIEVEKSVVEGAGASGLAACLSPKLQEQLKGKNVVVPLCGGNIDTAILGRCLERGLAADSRLIKCRVTLNDRPGGLQKLTEIVANVGASIKDIYHERAWVKHDIFSVDVKLVAETRDAAHSKELKTALFDFYGSHQVAWTN